MATEQQKTAYTAAGVAVLEETILKQNAYAEPVVQAFRRSWCIDSGLVVHAFR